MRVFMLPLLILPLALLGSVEVHPAEAEAQRPCGSETTIHHDLKVTLHPDEHTLSVEDTVTLAGRHDGAVRFELHDGLEPTAVTPKVAVMKESVKQAEVPVASYKVTLPPDLRTFVLVFRGKIHHALEPYGKELSRGFRDTPGTISEEGIYLAGSSLWYPRFGDELVTFDLEATVPGGWDAISQGERTLNETQESSRRVRWHSPDPQEDIFLIGGRFVEYSRPAGRVRTMVFLRERDQPLAEKYLEAAAQYLAMYDKLIGPYAYKKFALVENFWETGYGMPSFTLMGPKIIRLPFIIHSSYPHEILHNWWGNGVFVDLTRGNWCEGMTAYLSDYLIREEQGTAAAYRRDILQKYTDYVSKEADFPLADFRSRHSSATEAIGYGKALMFFHMLRPELGDKTFISGLRDFYRDNLFKLASYDDIRKSMEASSEKNLRPDFDQWVNRTGAPQLKMSDLHVRGEDNKHVVSIRLNQMQPGKAYHLHVPVAITVKGQESAYQTSALMKDKQHQAEFTVPGVPLRIDVDPEFDVFRRLSSEEIPPALTQVFGAKKLTILIPQNVSDELKQAFRRLAESWRTSGPEEVVVKDDAPGEKLPSDGAVVILGWNNGFAKEVASELVKYGAEVTEKGLTIGDRSFSRVDDSTVITVRRPGGKDLVLTWIASDRPAAIPGLARKIPHYHGYSYLVFTGNEPVNVLKGHWPVYESPLTMFLPDAGVIRKVEMGKLERRKPLTELP